jgi:glycine/D-amino acid oxidase-like deaminating enzyme
MQTDILIIGQGISGTFLSYYLHKAGIDYLVIDDNQADAPSKIAAGIINPVTGRRLVTVWKADELFPFAWEAYQEIGALLNVKAISQKDILDFFPNPFMRESFLKKKAEENPYIDIVETDYSPVFNYEFGIGTIKPVYTAHLQTLIPAWRKYLTSRNKLLAETFDAAHLQVSDQAVSYKDIRAKKIIFCDGAAGSNNSYFANLPFALNKGEALLVSIPGLSQEYVYKKAMLLAPLAEPDIFWIGSNYLWEFEDNQPTETFYQQTVQQLQHFLKLPFTVVDHLAGVRPATVERRPFAGFHPVHPAVGILNGMGTKGCSLSPYFAQQLTEHILNGTPISPEADISRYTKVLSR